MQGALLRSARKQMVNRNSVRLALRLPNMNRCVRLRLRPATSAPAHGSADNLRFPTADRRGAGFLPSPKARWSSRGKTNRRALQRALGREPTAVGYWDRLSSPTKARRPAERKRARGAAEPEIAGAVRCSDISAVSASRREALDGMGRRHKPLPPARVPRCKNCETPRDACRCSPLGIDCRRKRMAREQLNDRPNGRG